MSTDRQRLQAAIQRIAKQDPDISALISASKNKGGQASSSGIGASDAERDNLCCDGTTGAGANAGSDQRDPSEDGGDGLESTDPANLDAMGQGSLTGITDCSTGESICFDGSDWLPPDGWDDPQSPPIDDFYEEGFFWKHMSHAGGSPERAIRDFLESSETVNSISCDCVEVSSVTVECDCTYVDGNNVTKNYNDATVAKDECEGSSFENSDICTTVAAPDSWPEDSCANLISRGGKIVGSKFDPENDGSYSAPRDELEVCDADGDRILLRGSPTGGWKSIKSLSGDIDPDTDKGYLYRPNGQRVRQISPSEFRDDTV